MMTRQLQAQTFLPVAGIASGAQGSVSAVRKPKLRSRQRELREAAGLSLERLAEISGLSTGYLSKVENSHRKLGNNARKRIAEALGCSESDLLLDAPLRVAPYDTPRSIEGVSTGELQRMTEIEALATMLATLQMSNTDLSAALAKAIEMRSARPMRKATVAS